MAICFLVIANQMAPVKCSVPMIGSPLFWLTAPEGPPLQLGSINTPSHSHKVSACPYVHWNKHTYLDTKHTLWWGVNWERDHWCGRQTEYSSNSQQNGVLCNTMGRCVTAVCHISLCGLNDQLFYDSFCCSYCMHCYTHGHKNDNWVEWYFLMQ